MDGLRPTLRRDAVRAQDLKDRGNKCVEEGNLAGAYDLYTRALKLAPPLPRIWGEMAEFSELRAALFSNRALVAYRQGWLMSCVTDCSSSVCSNARGNGTAVNSMPLLGKSTARRRLAWERLDRLHPAKADKKEEPADAVGGPAVDPSVELEQLRPAVPWLGLSEVPLLRVLAFLSPLQLERLQLADRTTMALCQKGVLWDSLLPVLVGPMGTHEDCWTDPAFLKDCCLPEWLIDAAASARGGTPGQLRGPRNLGSLGCFPPVVVDVGTVYTKAGLAGAPLPSVLLCNHQILDRSTEITSMGLFTDDSEALRDFFREAIFGTLRADPRRHPVILCLSLFQSKQYHEDLYARRARLAEDALRDIGVPLVVSHHSPCLALFSHRRHTGVVVDIGLGLTRAIPVVRGHVCVEGIAMQTVGAANCTNYLLEVLRDREALGSLSPPTEQLTGYQVMMLVKLTKEEHGFVAASREEAHRAPHVETPALNAAFQRSMNFGKELATVGEMFFTPSLTGPQHSFFRPNTAQPTLGLHELVQTAINRCGEDFRSDLAASVVLAGGTSCIPGMRQRLQRELERLVASQPAAPERSPPQVLEVIPEVAWHGGSLVGCELWMSRHVRVEAEAAKGGQHRLGCWDMRN